MVKNQTKKISKKQQQKSKFDIIDYKKNYKKLMIIPLILFLFSIFSIYTTTQEEGTPIYRDVSLKGGLSAIIEINSNITDKELKDNLSSSFPQNSFLINQIFEKGIRTGFIIDTDLDEKLFLEKINSIFNTKFISGDNYMSNFISPTLSSAFFIQAIYILAISFTLMSIVIFMYFRELVPSGAVVLSALFDVIVTVGILDFFNVQISIAGIGALLMIIGYSIGTDVLLTNRLIKEHGYNYFEKAFGAFKTGTLMSLTTLTAGVAALILTNSGVIFEISLILVVGLMVDYISTWLQNNGILMMWLEKKSN